jgi:hypothetical protein
MNAGDRIDRLVTGMRDRTWSGVLGTGTVAGSIAMAGTGTVAGSIAMAGTGTVAGSIAMAGIGRRLPGAARRNPPIAPASGREDTGVST